MESSGRLQAVLPLSCPRQETERLLLAPQRTCCPRILSLVPRLPGGDILSPSQDNFRPGLTEPFRPGLWCPFSSRRSRPASQGLTPWG